MAEKRNPTEPTRTLCPYCGVGCGLEVLPPAQPGKPTNRDTQGNPLWQVRGDRSHPSSKGKVCIKGATVAESLDKNRVKPLAATEQILDGFAHQGNRYPTAYQPWDLVEPMADWMTKKGMKGIFAFDVATVKNQTDCYAIECNPRFNGASYPTGIARKLNIDSWCSDNFATKHHSLSEIDLGELEYNPTTKTGAIIYNWGSVLVGKLGILLAGSIAQQDELRFLLKQKLV